tara:strand:- start:404 stop:631 length:228 start_codon:yes stop_codon:yes gene_type:complete
MPRQITTWDNKIILKNKKEIGTKLFEDDPRADSYDKNGTVYNNYGTEAPRVKAWLGDESIKARKRAPKHLFKKKY